MKIRRYYGHDCGSDSGFNDGYYLDREPIEVKDEEEAMKLCLESLVELRGEVDEEELEEDDDGFTLTTGYYDDSGKSLTREQYQEAEEGTAGYRYVFVNFTEEA